MIILASILVGAFVAWITFSVFFKDIGDFFGCWRLYFTPEIFNIFRGEWHDARWAHAKLLIYLGISIGSGFMTRFSLQRYFSGQT